MAVRLMEGLHRFPEESVQLSFALVVFTRRRASAGRFRGLPVRPGVIHSLAGCRGQALARLGCGPFYQGSRFVSYEAHSEMQ